jgi:hypothetical protein
MSDGGENRERARSERKKKMGQKLIDGEKSVNAKRG